MLIYNIKVSRNFKMDWYQKYISLLRQQFFYTAIQSPKNK